MVITGGDLWWQSPVRKRRTTGMRRATGMRRTACTRRASWPLPVMGGGPGRWGGAGRLLCRYLRTLAQAGLQALTLARGTRAIGMRST